MSSHLSNGVPLLSPIFLSFRKVPSQRLKFSQDCHANECDFHEKSLVFYGYRATRPIPSLLLFGSTSPFTLRPRQRAFSHIDANELDFSLFLALFHSFLTHSDPYRIRSWRPFHEHVHSRRRFFSVFVSYKNSLFHSYLISTMVFTRFRRVFSIYTYPVCRDRTTWFDEPSGNRIPFHTSSNQPPGVRSGILIPEPPWIRRRSLFILYGSTAA